MHSLRASRGSSLGLPLELERTSKNNPERPALSPLLICGGIAGLFLSIALFHYLMLRAELSDLREQSARIAARAAAMDQDFQSAQKRLPQLLAYAQTRAAILSFARNRVTWAPILTLIASVQPAQMDIASLDCLCMGQKECILRISGSISSPHARNDCDNFRKKLELALKEIGISTEGKFSRMTDIETVTEKSGPGLTEGPAQASTEFAIEFAWNNQPDAR